MNALRTLALLLGIVIFAIGAGLLWVSSTGMSTRAKPGNLETSLGRGLRNLSIPKSARQMRNPMTASPEALVEGQRHFADHCASCHGNDGSGATEMGQKLYPPAPDMNLPATQNLTDGELYYIIENGVRFTAMPAWGAGGVDDHDTWHLVLFIRHLPQMSRQDLLDMQNYNPRSPMEMQEEQKENEFLNGPSK
jgi:mono/diheme cytochrome c family protein